MKRKKLIELNITEKCPYCNAKLKGWYNGICVLRCENHFTIAEPTLAASLSHLDMIKREMERYRKAKKQELIAIYGRSFCE